MAPDISVVMPTFRRPQKVVEAIGSVLSQEGVQVSILVLDDSPEGSAAVAVQSIRDLRVRYVKMEHPSGGKPALVRNLGWPMTNGRFVHFMDDDDRLAPGAHAAMVQALDSHPRAGMVFGRIEPFGNNPEILHHEQQFFANAARRAGRIHRLGSRHLMAATMMFRGTMLVNSACMLRRECIEPLGGYPTDCEVIEDVEFYTRAIRRFGCVFLDRTVLYYRTGDVSLMSHPPSADSAARSWKLSYQRYQREFGRLEPAVMKLMTKTVFRWL